MRIAGRAIAVLAISLIGCGTAHDVARTVAAPVRYVLNEPEPTPIPNTSDVTHPGQPIPVASPSATQRVTSRTNRTGSTSASRSSAAATAKSSPAASPAPAAAQFPVAKPVPGKPGLVFNPFDPNAGYIDVSGYVPGSKVRDPTTLKIFVVP